MRPQSSLSVAALAGSESVRVNKGATLLNFPSVLIAVEHGLLTSFANSEF